MVVTNGSGNVVTCYTMDAFGNVLQITQGGDFGSTAQTDYQPYRLPRKSFH